MEYKIYYFLIKFVVKPLWNSKCKIIHIIWKIFRVLFNFIFKVDIDPNAKIWKWVLFTHFIWIVIWESEIWKNCVIRQNVTIWRKTLNDKKYPIIWNNVQIWAWAIIIWDIKIWDNVQIWAWTIVLKDVPDNSIIVGNPWRIL